MAVDSPQLESEENGLIPKKAITEYSPSPFVEEAREKTVPSISTHSSKYTKPSMVRPPLKKMLSYNKSTNKVQAESTTPSADG